MEEKLHGEKCCAMNNNHRLYQRMKDLWAGLHDIWRNIIKYLRDVKRFSITISELKQDIDNQKDEISHLNNIINELPGDIYWKDPEGLYLGMNEQGKANLRKMGFLRKGDDIVGNTDYNLFDKQTADRFRENDVQIMQSGVADTREETAVLPSGEKITQLSTKRPLFDMHGKVIGIMGNTINITDRKRQEQELRIAKEEAEISNRIKSSFISDMEHNIRTPLSSLLGMLMILANQETDPEKKSVLHELANCAQELMGYYDKILDFSEVESGSYPITSKSFVLRKVVDSVMKIESISAKYKKLDLSLQYDKDLPEIVRGDSYRLQRILIDLVSNAIQFTEEGFAKLEVSFYKQDKRSRQIIVKFTIKDSGRGIPDNEKSLIYERFTRVTPSNKEQSKGLGLGLPIIKRFIDELDGEIHLKSKVGKGSTFMVFLPFKIPLSDDIVDEE